MLWRRSLVSIDSMVREIGRKRGKAVKERLVNQKEMSVESVLESGLGLSWRLNGVFGSRLPVVFTPTTLSIECQRW